MIDLGAPHQVIDRGDPRCSERHQDAWIAGHQTGAILLESQDSHMIGARFKPGGAAALFPFPIDELTDMVVPLRFDLGRLIRRAHASASGSIILRLNVMVCSSKPCAPTSRNPASRSTLSWKRLARSSAPVGTCPSRRLALPWTSATNT